MQPKKTSALMACLFLGACAESEIPHYLINDSELLTLTGGEQLSYLVLKTLDNGEQQGRYTLTLQTSTELDPDNNAIDTFLERFDNLNNISLPFLPRHLIQNTSGDIEFTAVNFQGETYWLDKEMQDDHLILYRSNINEDNQVYSINKGLLNCIDDVCTNSGTIEIDMQFVKEEVTQTPYADFDTYKLNINMAVNISNTEQTGEFKTLFIQGSEWIYPLLGVVKYEYQINDGISNNIYTAHLSNTNISIPESFKAAE